MTDKAPLVETLEATVPAVGATADGDQSIGEAPFDGTVTGVSYTPEANITGANTETRTFTLVNKGSDGNGTTVVATLAMTNGVNATDFNESTMTLSVVADATDVSQGDILAFVSTHSGSSGLADPGGLVQVGISRS